MAKEIKLTKGMYTTVDDDDYDELNKHKWHLDFYGYAVSDIRIGEKRTVFLIHRLIMGNIKGIIYDHMDGDKLNNQKSNLRICTRQQNQFNSCSRGGTSQYKGVCYRKDNKKWQAQAEYCGKMIYLGYFKNEVDAAMAYNRFAAEYHGEFARLNEILGERSNT